MSASRPKFEYQGDYSPYEAALAALQLISKGEHKVALVAWEMAHDAHVTRAINGTATDNPGLLRATRHAIVRGGRALGIVGQVRKNIDAPPVAAAPPAPA